MRRFTSLAISEDFESVFEVQSLLAPPSSSSEDDTGGAPSRSVSSNASADLQDDKGTVAIPLTPRTRSASRSHLRRRPGRLRLDCVLIPPMKPSLARVFAAFRKSAAKGLLASDKLGLPRESLAPNTCDVSTVPAPSISPSDIPASNDSVSIKEPPLVKKHAPAAKNQGTTCHECRRRRGLPSMRCTVTKGYLGRSDACYALFCQACVETRHDFPFDVTSTTFVCPRCMGTCTCVTCRRKRGEEAEFCGPPTAKRRKSVRQPSIDSTTTAESDFEVEDGTASASRQSKRKTRIRHYVGKHPKRPWEETKNTFDEFVEEMECLGKDRAKIGRIFIGNGKKLPKTIPKINEPEPSFSIPQSPSLGVQQSVNDFSDIFGYDGQPTLDWDSKSDSAWQPSLDVPFDYDHVWPGDDGLSQPSLFHHSFAPEQTYLHTHIIESEPFAYSGHPHYPGQYDPPLYPNPASAPGYHPPLQPYAISPLPHPATETISSAPLADAEQEQYFSFPESDPNPITEHPLYSLAWEDIERAMRAGLGHIGVTVM